MPCLPSPSRVPCALPPLENEAKEESESGDGSEDFDHKPCREARSDSGTLSAKPQPRGSRFAKSASGTELAQRRVQAYFAGRRQSRREERRSAAQQRISGVDLEAFREVTQARVKGRKASSQDVAAPAAWPPGSRGEDELGAATSNTDGLPALAQALKPSRRRIAVVGGGPVGLWVANLISLCHARRVKRGKGFVRSPYAPEIVIFERRAPESHCSRRNVRITLDEHTVALLNKHTKSTKFCSGMALAEIESILLEQWERLSGKPLEFASHIGGPEELAQKDYWDLILWAGGRHSLSDEIREPLGCNMQVGESEVPLVFEMRDFTPIRRSSGTTKAGLPDLQELAAVDLTSVARKGALAAVSPSAGSACSLKVVLRAACDGEVATGSRGAACRPLGWLWLLGLPPEMKAARVAAGPAPGDKSHERHGSLSEALEAELARLGVAAAGAETPGTGDCNSKAVPPWVRQVQGAVAALQEKVLLPGGVTTRWVEAAYWSSDRVVCAIPGKTPGQSTPMILIGDAAMGKPFYTGTTLNVHLAEVKALSKLPMVRWGQNCDANSNAAATGDGERRAPYRKAGANAALAPYLVYEQRYKQLLSRTHAFNRPSGTRSADS